MRHPPVLKDVGHLDGRRAQTKYSQTDYHLFNVFITKKVFFTDSSQPPTAILLPFARLSS